MKPRTTLRKALDDPRLLGSAIPGETWAGWRSLLIATMGEPLEPDELEHFRRLTGRQEAPAERVDELWCVIGTTNIDNRSFEHNDEVNVAMRDRTVAERLLQDYDRDMADSEEMTLDRWRRRPAWEKIVGPFVWILERHQ